MQVIDVDLNAPRVRELARAERVLGQVERFLKAHDQMTGYLHLAERELQSPLTKAVVEVRVELKSALVLLARGATSSEAELDNELSFWPGGPTRSLPIWDKDGER